MKYTKKNFLIIKQALLFKGSNQAVRYDVVKFKQHLGFIVSNKSIMQIESEVAKTRK